MKDLLTAVVEAASRTGQRAAIIVVDGDGAAPDGMGVNTAPAMAAHETGDAMKQLARQRDSALNQNQQLGAQLQELQKQLGTAQQELANARDRSSEAFGDAGKEIAKLKEAKAQLEAELQAARAAPAPAGDNGGQPEAIIPWDSVPIDTLGCSEKLTAIFKRKGWETAGELRAAFLADPPFEGHSKINRMDRLEVAAKLLGAAPNAAVSVASVAAPAVVPNGVDPTAPAGLKGKNWAERYVAVKKKIKKRADTDQNIVNLEAMSKEGYTMVRDPKGQEIPIGEAMVEEKKRRDATHHQISALMWTLDLDPTAPSLETAFGTAGVPMPPETETAEAPA